MNMKRTALKTVCMIFVMLVFCLGQASAASCGDVNSSGGADIVDALLIAQYYVGLNPSNFDATVADVNGNGTTDIVDALLVAQFYVGLVSELSCSTNVTSVPTAAPTPGGSISIACGSSSAVGSFQADQYYTGGSTYNNSNTIDVSQITTNPPPAALFNNERYGAMSYTIPGFAAGDAYTVTLYFAETYLTSSGSRLFSVSINGNTVLSNFDIFASAGGQNKGIAESFGSVADGSGQIVIQLTAVTENPKINGISIQPGLGPTVGPTDVPTSVPTVAPTNPPAGDLWNLPALPIESGPYSANYDSLINYYTPAWFRDAKIGLWQHWDPQSVPEQGDWYARGMYIQGSSQYNYHVSHYGHPSVFGYKDICNLFTAPNWDPVALIDQYVKTGAKYVVCLANHHDNYDMWNSTYQPWNVMNVGPKKDIMSLFVQAAKNKGLRFGMTFHATPPRTWGQFMPVKYGSDSGGQYDGLMTKADGAGKWWNGMDPKDLYGPNHTSTNPSLTSPFANQFMWRVDDAITKYHPDLIYFDEHAGHTQVDLGVNMGLDFLSPQICANFYNKNYAWNGGIMDQAVCNMKGIGGTYNSFQGEDAVLEKAYHSMVPDTEKIVDSTIQAYAFQIDESLGEWHYLSGMGFKSSANVISILLDIVSKNGNLLLCLPTHGNGSLEPASVTICNEIGSWLSQNGEAIYGSRPFEACQESGGGVYFTRRAGYVYAIAAAWPSNNQLVLPALKQKSNSTIGNVQKVEFLGSSLSFSQTTSSLTISCPSSHTGSQAYVFRITHDKPWINDDDPGVKYTGYWKHQANRGLGDYNNDGYFTQISGATCEYTFNGTGIDYISEKYSDMGNVDVYIDGVLKQNVNLYNGTRLVQQVVYGIAGLASGSHTIKIVNKSTQYGNVDAFRIY